jgi:hypothetical protein
LYGGVVLLGAVSFCALFLWVTHDEQIVGTLPSPEDYAFDQASVGSSHRRVELAGGADAT